MNFDEWYKNYLITAESWNRNLAKKAWDAAIDEAVKVANELATEKVNDNFIYDADVGEKIKELK